MHTTNVYHVYIFVNSISLNEAGRHLMYFANNLFSGGSYVSDCLAVFLGVSPALTVNVLNYNVVFCLSLYRAK